MNNEFICEDCWKIYKKRVISCIKCWGNVSKYDGELDIKVKSKVLSNNVEFYDFNKENSGEEIQEEERYDLWHKELNKLFWWGLRKGSAVLFTWDPWNWKSTLFAQMTNMINVNNGWKIWYFSWEESEDQVSGRLKRIWIINEIKEKVLLKFSWNLETILASLEKEKIEFLFIDSVQTLYSTEVEWKAGGRTQIEFCTSKIISECKKRKITVLMAVQITKSWVIAWPKTLEHAWDTTIYIKKEEFDWRQIRLFRVEKNRFWSTDALITAEMKEDWFHFISQEEASKLFIEESEIDDKDNWFVFSILMEWNSPFFVEVQAITSMSHWENPVRRATWYSLDRLYQVIAIIESYWIVLFWSDIFINVVWKDNASDSQSLDLAVITALLSSKEQKNLWNQTIAFWEVWLRWEIRNVKYRDKINNFVKDSWFKKVFSKINGYKHIRELIEELIWQRK